MSRQSATIFHWLILAWLSIGLIAAILAFIHLFYTPSAALLLLPSCILISFSWQWLHKWRSFSSSEKGLLILLLTFWLLHFLGVLVPETGFDAVWYHLPVMKAIVNEHGLVYVPELYQSLNPLFSDLIFGLVYQALGVQGSKVVAYLFGLSLLIISYGVVRTFTSRFWGLLFCIMISSYQVIAWQSSSFYVDLAKAFWEVAALYMLLPKLTVSASVSQSKARWIVLLAGMCLGASVATKAFSILLIPVFMFLLWLWVKRDKLFHQLVFACGWIVVVLPFYLRTWWYAGTPFMSLGLHVQKLDEIGGNSDINAYLWQKLLSLPKSWFELFFVVPDYVSIALLILLPLTIWYVWHARKNLLVLGLSIFGVAQWLIWWFVPPLSTRYAVSGFVILGALTIKATQVWIAKRAEYKLPLLMVIGLAFALSVVPRLVVAARQLRYITGNQSEMQYLQQFKDGSIDVHLDAWYGPTSSSK